MDHIKELESAVHADRSSVDRGVKALHGIYRKGRGSLALAAI